MVDAVLVHHALHVVDAPQAWQRIQPRIVSVSQIADDAKPQLAMRSHPLHDRHGQLTAAGDQNAIEILPRPVTPIDDCPDEHAPADHEQNRADHEDG